MKKSLFLLMIAFLFSRLSFADTNLTEKKFIKASLSDKIKIIESLDEKETVVIPQKALLFAIENAAVLSSDEELIKLVISSIKAFPSEPEKIQTIKKPVQKIISEHLMTVFKLFNNMPLRKEAMDKLSLYSEESLPLLVDFLNDYLSSSFKRGEASKNILESAIVTLGNIGNHDSLTIIYNIWATKIWPE